MKNRLPKRLSAWLLTLIMLVGMLPAMASADEVDEDLAPPAPQEDYGYVRLVFSEGEQLDLYHGEYITECSPTAAVHDGADEDFLTDGDYLALYYEGRLYHKAALDGVSIDADAVLPADDFALVPMGKLAAQESPSGAEPEAPTTEGTTEQSEPQPENEDPEEVREEQTVSQPAMLAAATEDACIKVIMDNGQTLYLYPGNTIKKNHSGDYYTEAVTNRPSSIYVARLMKTDMYQWTLELNNFNGQSITYVPGNNKANSVVITLMGENVLAPKDGYAVDANQNNYRAISCGKETGDGKPQGLSFIINGGGSLAIRANDNVSAYQMWAAQCIFTQGLTIRGDAKVSIDLKLPSYQDTDSDSHTIFTSNLYVFDNASLDIKSYNLAEVVRASAHDRGGKSFISIDTTGTVNVEFGCDSLERTYPRVFCGYPDSTVCVYSIDKVGYMSIARKGSRTDNYNEPDRFDFVAYPDITVSEDVTVKTFTSDNIKRIQYFPRLAAAVRVRLFDGRIQDGKFKPYDELWGPLKDKSVDITITAPESAAPFARWSTITENLTAEDPGANLPVNGQPVSNKTVTLHITGAGHYYILAKYDPFGGTPTWTKGYSPVANCTTGTVSWTAPDSMKDVKGMLVPATFQLSGSSPVAATDKSGNDIKDVVSGVSVFAKQSGSGITYALSDTGAKRVALNFDGRWHFSEPFVPDLDKLTLPPAPQLASLNCSGEETPLIPGAAACYPFARGLIVKATNFDYDQYEMYYTFNNGGSDPGAPTGTSPSTSNGIIVLKDSDTWTGVTNLRVRFKSKETGAWSVTTRIPLQKVLESQLELYEVAFAPEENYTQSGDTLTIKAPITATVTKDQPDEWPINAELVYNTNRVALSSTYTNYTEETVISFDPDTIAASGYDAAYLRVGVRVPDPKSSSNDSAILGGATSYTIKLPESHKLFLWDCTATVDDKPAADNSNVAVGKTVILTPTIPEGYTFKGWNSPDGLTITDLGNDTYSFTMPKQNVTIKAILYANEYTSMTVIFDVYSGSSIVSNMSGIRHTVSGVDGATTEITFYKGNTPYNNGALDKDSGCYRAHITCHAAENAIFSDNMKLRANCKVNSSNGQLLKGGFTLSADKKTLEFDVWLVFAPEVTVPLYEGESKPTAEQCTTQPGIKVTSLTWSGNTIQEMKIKDEYLVGDSCSLFRLAANPKVWINGVLYDASYDYEGAYALTVKNTTIPTVPKGVTVSGTVTSYGDETEKTYVQLIPAGGSEPDYEAIVSDNSGSYSIPTVPAGTYTLKVMKKGHAPWTEEITVGSTDVTKDVTIYLIGDVNKDGVITPLDMQRLYNHLNGTATLADTSTADVNQDGGVTPLDMQRLYNHLNNTKPL